MKVLIIGGTGLISTGIVKALTGTASITVFNRGKTHSRLPGDVRRITGDRADPGTLARLCGKDSGETFDAVIDMICFQGAQAMEDVEVFSGRTGHFIFCSTVCAYGNTQTQIPTVESSEAHPESTYGRNKLECEKIFLQAHTAGRLPVTIFRPSHTFGPGASLINNLGWQNEFISRLRQGRPILVSGDGHGLWQSAFCDDVGVGFAKAIGRPKTVGEVYNIVGRDVFTWDQYTQRIAAALNAPPPRLVHVATDTLLELQPQRYGGLAEIFRYHGVYSNDKIDRDIPEYRHGTSFADAVRQTVAWMDAQGSHADGVSPEDHIIAAIGDMTTQLKKTLI
ncbi:MAG: NAD-dependent epimerase/dehydratase family protein [Phycisphaerae bacterium]|nr:NAD-dependent epimerase/dehydratase family protein [Phycisphaerae bacterium]